MQSILEVKELTKVYRQRRGEDVLAVDHVSFSVNKNEVVGLLGPNGAGKTTTIKCLATLIEPTSGEIWITGVNHAKTGRGPWRGSPLSWRETGTFIGGSPPGRI